ncbi:catalase-like [Anticarsia gemmatalis]|uniref:catalase-like n=1 Tax=Anticarsia gemmatalis TaxID=129554 RepID=UPI003F765B21
MRLFVAYLVCLSILVEHVTCYRYCNETPPPDVASQQLPEFRLRHPNPIGVLTKVTGEPLDIRDTVTLNTEIFDNRNHFRLSSHLDRERIPERVVHSKGGGAFGYFEVTHDVSRYTKADVFNGIGKRTPVMARFSTNRQKLGGNDVTRDVRAIALKMYTREGILDFITFHIPIFFYRDPINFSLNGRAFRRNPRTGLFDSMMRWDFMTLRPEVLFSNLFIMQDLGIPDGYRKTDYFPLHVYEIYNKHGERFFVKFNFRTEIGLFNLTNSQAMVIGAEDPDYFNRDLYNSIAAKNYPSWRLEMDILTKEQITQVDFDPFDMTRLWRRGTYRTVTIGRLVMNRRVDNHFKDTEQGAFSPDNLVPGIVGPHDVVFRSRRLFYPDTQNYRLGVNHANIPVNSPLYVKTYSRDGVPPVLDNMRDAPNYQPNSFNGPMPFVDEARPKDLPFVIHSNAIDLQPIAEFYNEILEDDAHRQRVADNVAESLEPVSPALEKRALRLLSLADVDLGRRVRNALKVLRKVSSEERREQYTQCFANAGRHHNHRH